MLNIRKIIRNMLLESEDRYPLIPYGEHMDDVDFEEEYGIDEYEAADKAEDIAKNSGVTILRSMNLSGILMDTEMNRVIGGIWTNDDSENFSFDIAIDSGYRGMGLSGKLIDYAISEYQYKKDEFGDDFKMEVDVINPILAKTLEKKYGFKIISHIDQNRVIMGL